MVSRKVKNIPRPTGASIYVNAPENTRMQVVRHHRLNGHAGKNNSPEAVLSVEDQTIGGNFDRVPV